MLRTIYSIMILKFIDKPIYCSANNSKIDENNENENTRMRDKKDDFNKHILLRCDLKDHTLVRECKILRSIDQNMTLSKKEKIIEISLHIFLLSSDTLDDSDKSDNDSPPSNSAFKI